MGSFKASMTALPKASSKASSQGKHGDSIFSHQGRTQQRIPVDFFNLSKLQLMLLQRHHRLQQSSYITSGLHKILYIAHHHRLGDYCQATRGIQTKVYYKKFPARFLLIPFEIWSIINLIVQVTIRRDQEEEILASIGGYKRRRIQGIIILLDCERGHLREATAYSRHP